MKQTKKEIEATLRNRIANQYRERTTILENKIEMLADDYNKLNAKFVKVQNDLLEAQDKIRQYEEWIERMQDFCNMTEGDRKKAMMEYEVQSALGGFIEKYNGLFSNLFK